MAQQSKTKRFSDPEELTRLLKQYWLVTEGSPIMEVVKAVAKSYFHGTPAKFAYVELPAVDVRPLMCELGILDSTRHAVFYDTPPKSPTPFEYIVPCTTARSDDLELLLPFALEQAKRLYPNLSRENLCFEGLFILTARDAIERSAAPLCDVIADAYIRADEGVLIAGDIPEDRQKRFYDLLYGLSPLAALYIGLIHDKVAKRVGPFVCKQPRSWINWFTHGRYSEISEEETNEDWNRKLFMSGVFDESDLENQKRSKSKPRTLINLQRNYRLNASDIGLITRNLSRLNEIKSPESCRSWINTLTKANEALKRLGGDEEVDSVFPCGGFRDQEHLNEWAGKYRRAESCLVMRLNGQSEEDIAKALGFASIGDYLAFQRSWNIGIVDIDKECDPSGIIGRWDKARAKLGTESGYVEVCAAPEPRGCDIQIDSAQKVEGPSTNNASLAQNSLNATLPTKSSTLDLPGDLKWSDVSIIFTSEHTAWVKARDFAQEVGFRMLGFMDVRRSRGASAVPDTRWCVLQKMAELGELSWQSGAESDLGVDVKAAVRDIRTTLKKTFGIADDPFEPYQTARAYKPKFTLADNRPKSNND